MINSLKNVNLLTNICRYLNKDTIIQLSHCNQAINKALNPENNGIINLIFMIEVNDSFFEFDEDYNLRNKKNLLSKLLNSKTNWKKVFIELNKNFNNYEDNIITQKVKDCFKTHMYLPDLRKDNAQLEFSSSSIYQTFCYDSLFRNACTYNYYGKYITNEYMAKDPQKEKKEIQNEKVEKNEEKKEKGQKNNETEDKKENKNKDEIQILREGLYFEKELKDFRLVFNKLVNNIYYINIIINTVKYNYEYIDFIYSKNNKCKNKIINLLLWITHSFILYSNFIYKYITSFDDKTDEKTILNEFVKKHNEIINCALLLNSNFENINIIINQFIIHYSNYKPNDKNNLNLVRQSQTSSEEFTNPTSSNKNGSSTEISTSFDESNEIPSENDDTSNINNENFNLNSKDKFSLCILFLIIIKKNIYDKLSQTLTQKLNKLIALFYNDLFQNFNIKNNKNSKNSNTLSLNNICNNLCLNQCNNNLMDLDDADYCDNDEDLEDDLIEKDPTEKEIIESFINCEVDFTINERNANGINHTELKITKEYEKIENVIIDQFYNTLQYFMNEDKPNSYLFEIIEKYTKCDANQCNIFKNGDSLILIRRTKKRLMEKNFKYLFKKVIKTLGNSFLSHIKINENNKKFIYLSDTETKNNNEYKCDLRDVSSKKRIKIAEAVTNEINTLKFNLKEENIKAYDAEYQKREIESLIDDFFNNDGIEEVLLVKKMIWFYYRELGIYEEKNEKIIKLLNYRKENSLTDCFEEKRALLNGESI